MSEPGSSGPNPSGPNPSGQGSSIPRHTRGRRPHFFEDPAVDQLLGVLLAVIQELSVVRERLDAMHRVLDRKGQVTRADVEDFVPDAAAAAEIAAARAEYLQRVFRVLRSEAGVLPSAEAEQYVAKLASELEAAAEP